MNQASRILNMAASLALTTLCASAFAQTAVVSKSTCQGVNVAPQEAIGDGEGHAMPVGRYSCRSAGAPTGDSIMTGMIVWNRDNGSHEMLVGDGVNRKTDGLAVYQNTEGTNSLIMVDGKVTGFTATTKGFYQWATSSMSSLGGKSFTDTFHSLGHGYFVVEMTND